MQPEVHPSKDFPLQLMRSACKRKVLTQEISRAISRGVVLTHHGVLREISYSTFNRRRPVEILRLHGIHKLSCFGREALRLHVENIGVEGIFITLAASPFFLSLRRY